MIIVKIYEGLGNQMFQYAYARSQSLRYKIPFKLYLVNQNGASMPENLTDDEKRKYKIVRRWYENDSVHREYLLSKFNIIENIASEIEVYDIIRCNGKNFIEYKWKLFKNKVAPYYRRTVVQESKDTCYDKNLLKTKSNSYLEGYYASELYFKDFADVIRKDFEFKDQTSYVNIEKIKQIQQCNSVCISIRRGDFINKPLHNVCKMNYFYDSMVYIAKNVDNPYFYIFSDDNEWLKNNFKTEFPHEFVTHNYPDFIEDFRLMQNCKHHIIPNSTFSWWAAWLSKKPDSIIIAPQKWLNTETIDYSKVIPERWIKIVN